MVTTMKDVAKEAGVSVATVSRVINDSGFVSDELRDRVERVMKDLRYRPSNVARSLRKQETRTIAVMVPQLDLPFFSSLTLAIQQRLFEHNYYTFTCSTMESLEEEQAYIDMLLGQRVDGVIIAPTGHNPEAVQRMADANVPIVLVDRDIPDITNIDRVLFDNHGGACMGAEHLVRMGHKQITIFGGPMHSEAIGQRIKGASATLLRHAGVHFDVVVPASSANQFESNFEAATQVLSETNRPTAFFALTDDAAVAVIHAARKMDLSVPDDLSVMGFDDVPVASHVYPMLTTIAQPIRKMGQTT
ncbi:MAG: LacI family DNA-binding transcriptional regulator, partial [Chloroflexota bacterium]